MSVRKYRSIEEMEEARWHEPGSEEHVRAVRFVWDFARHACPARYPPGVHKHRSIEELWAQEEEWERLNFEAFWERRRALSRDAPPPRTPGGT